MTGTIMMMALVTVVAMVNSKNTTYRPAVKQPCPLLAFVKALVTQKGEPGAEEAACGTVGGVPEEHGAEGDEGEAEAEVHCGCIEIGIGI